MPRVGPRAAHCGPCSLHVWPVSQEGEAVLEPTALESHCAHAQGAQSYPTFGERHPMRWLAGAIFVLFVFELTQASAQYPQYRRPGQPQEECPQGRQIRAQKAYPATMTDCEVLDADTAAENQKQRGGTARAPQPPPPQTPAAPKIDLVKQRVEGDLKMGYPPATFEDFALDFKTMVRDEKKIAVEGFYRKTGNIDLLYASQTESFSTVSAPTSHIIPLLVEDAPRDIRAYYLRCSEQSPNTGCWTRVRGTVTMCSLTIFGNSVPKPCISVEGGWFSKQTE